MNIPLRKPDPLEKAIYELLLEHLGGADRERLVRGEVVVTTLPCVPTKRVVSGVTDANA